MTKQEIEIKRLELEIERLKLLIEELNLPPEPNLWGPTQMPKQELWPIGKPINPKFPNAICMYACGPASDDPVRWWGKSPQQ
jgi:hypothetical protein